MAEKNIAITPYLMQHLREEGYDTGPGVSRQRTLAGESWKEWFCTQADVEEVIRVFTMHDPALHHEGSIKDYHVIMNGDTRLKILLQRNEDKDRTNIWVRYRPSHWSWEKSI